ncbi:MAG: NAD(P)H-dependent oxidoreductase [Spirochaetales bacterium]|nr:NAD(P)H-dependent oxidoreductase [Spirochaetales bacterium]
MKKILFINGSPRGNRSSSLGVAMYLSLFLNYDYEFINVNDSSNNNTVHLTPQADEAEPAFQSILEKIKTTDVIVWTFGVYLGYVPVKLQYLLDKLIAQQYYFKNKSAASIVTSINIFDNYALDKIRLVSENLGFSYVGEISAEANPQLGYLNEKNTETACQVLAKKINHAIEINFLPTPKYPDTYRRYISPVHFGNYFKLNKAKVEKRNNKSILVITGNKITKDAEALSIVEIVRNYSINKVELIEIEEYKISTCTGCLVCNSIIGHGCRFQKKDRFNEIIRKMEASDGIICIGHSSSGFVDVYLKTLMERAYGLFHRPFLNPKYGFVVITGGGIIGNDVACYVNDFFSRIGVKTIAHLGLDENNMTNIAETIHQYVNELDSAMAEKWEILPCYSHLALDAMLRNRIASLGMMLREDFLYYIQNKLFIFPNLIKTTFFFFLFTNNKIRNIIIKRRVKKVNQKRKARYKQIIQSGLVGKGKNLNAITGCPVKYN